jgi:hypothetical protein
VCGQKTEKKLPTRIGVVTKIMEHRNNGRQYLGSFAFVQMSRRNSSTGFLPQHSVTPACAPTATTSTTPFSTGPQQHPSLPSNANDRSSRNSSRDRYSSHPKKSSSSTNMKHGVNLQKLHAWSTKIHQQQQANEESRQEMALMKMKSIVISNAMIVRMQSWWRMKKCRLKYLKYRKERFYFLFKYFRGWFTAIRAEISYRVPSIPFLITLLTIF